MPEFDVRLVTGDIDPVLEHQTPRHDRLILDVVLCKDAGKKVVANGTPEDFRVIGRTLIEIADTAEPPHVASTEADYDAAEARYEACGGRPRVRCLIDAADVYRGRPEWHAAGDVLTVVSGFGTGWYHFDEIPGGWRASEFEPVGVAPEVSVVSNRFES